jgi:anion-transporting  ArsA/GET3 family ATPase
VTDVIVITGAGGVGKTTLSAAVAVAAAGADRSTLVITVDPAKRLADALDVGDMGDRPVSVNAVEGLWAATLDVTSSWEAIVRRYSDPVVADRLLVNPFFRAIADRFPAAQSFAAAETMTTLIETGDWDLIVVDTPPSAGGLDFYLAPARTADLVGGRLLHWLTGAQLPGRRFLYRFTGKPLLRIADTVLGGPLLEDVAEFLLDLRSMYDALTARADTMQRYLQQAKTIVVTTADPAPVAEVSRFFEELTEVAIRPRAIVLNRALPRSWADAAKEPVTGIDDPAVAAELHRNLANWGGEARRQAVAMEGLADRYAVPLVAVPWMPVPPTDADGLRRLLADVDVSWLWRSS